MSDEEISRADFERLERRLQEEHDGWTRATQDLSNRSATEHAKLREEIKQARVAPIREYRLPEPEPEPEPDADRMDDSPPPEPEPEPEPDDRGDGPRDHGIIDRIQNRPPEGQRRKSVSPFMRKPPR